MRNITPHNMDPITAGRVWTVKCLGFFGMIVLAWFADQLLFVTCFGILVASYWEGFRHYKPVANYLRNDMHHSAAFIAETQKFLKEVSSKLAGMDTTGASSAMKLAVMVCKYSGRISKKDAVDVFLLRMETQINRLIMPVKKASEMAPGLGLLGSLVGIVQSVSAMDTPGGDLFAGIATMATTTGVGIACSIFLSGLHSDLENAKKVFIDDLRLFGYLIAGIDDGGSDDEPQASIF